MHILDDYIILRKDNLETVSIVKGKDWLFKKNRFMLLVISCIAMTAVSLMLLVGFEIEHRIYVHNIKKEHERIMNIHMGITDSLQMELSETARENTLADMCYEAISTKCPTATHDRIWEFILECDPWYPDIIMMQAVQESNCGKSVVSRRCNNLFGMKKPGVRGWRCDVNQHNRMEQYAEYENWKMSVIDRILWEKWMFRTSTGKPSLDEYLKMIGNVYNTETPGYTEMIYNNASKYRKMIE